MEPIRILHVVGTMNRGGTETLIMELYRHIDRSKVQFDFLIYNYSDKPGAFDEEILSLGGKIYNAKRRFYKGPIAFCKELKTFFKMHPEYSVIHAHQYAASGYILAMAKKALPTCVTIAHSHIAFVKTDFLRNLADSIGKKLLKKYADYAFGCSEDALYELFGKRSNQTNCFVINNAINPGKFKFDVQKRGYWREQFGAGANTLIIGNVARFTYQKNHEKIIETFHAVSKKNTDSLLVLIGEGSRQEQMRQMVKEFGIEEKVLFMGVRDDVQDIINAFDVFLMPSRYEGLGIVLVEAQANGLPCVMSADVIPAEADVGTGLVTRVSLEKNAQIWAKRCMESPGRLASEKAQQAVADAGYDIHKTAAWIQDFYLKKWK